MKNEDYPNNSAFRGPASVPVRWFCSRLRAYFAIAALLLGLGGLTGKTPFFDVLGVMEVFAAESPSERVIWSECRIENGENIVIRGELTGAVTPSDTALGADPNLYLIELNPNDDDVSGKRCSRQMTKALGSVEFRLPLQLDTANSRLYKKFIACIWDGAKYVQVSEPIYVTNPESVARNFEPYQEPTSKKGLLVELTEIEDALELDVKNVIFTIPYNFLFGEGIDYLYDGKTYHLNQEVIEAFDKAISTYSNDGILVTAVLMNGWHDGTPDYYYPGTTQNSRAYYYHFNSRTETGYRDIAAVATFLADRYSGSSADCGKIQNWIIGNEINNQQWNYIGPMSLSDYVNEYERTFRIFYTAIRSRTANARVFFSTDNNWMNEANGSTKYNAKDFIDYFAALCKQRGDIDWNLAYHPYSTPITEPEFWDDFSSGLVSWSSSSPVIDFANLSVLTDYMQRSELLSPSGSVRHIILSEQGFTSQSPTRGNVEMQQAAAFAYAYYIADSNPYIDSVIMSRQIDAPSEAASSLAFGLWTTDAVADENITPVSKKYIWTVFRDIDNASTTLSATEFAKPIIGISRWSDVIPSFKWSALEG